MSRVRPYRDRLGRAKGVPGVASAIALLATLSALTAVAGCGDGSDERSQSPDREATRIAAGFDQERAFRDLEAQVRLGPRPTGSAAK